MSQKQSTCPHELPYCLCAEIWREHRTALALFLRPIIPLGQHLSGRQRSSALSSPWRKRTHFKQTIPKQASVISRKKKKAPKKWSQFWIPQRAGYHILHAKFNKLCCIASANWRRWESAGDIFSHVPEARSGRERVGRLSSPQFLPMLAVLKIRSSHSITPRGDHHTHTHTPPNLSRPLKALTSADITTITQHNEARLHNSRVGYGYGTWFCCSLIFGVRALM